MHRPISQRWRIAIFYAAFGLLFVVGLLLLVGGTAGSASRTDDASTPSLNASDLPIYSVNEFDRRDPFTTIKTLSQWQAATTQGRTILFVDGNWNLEIVAFHKPFTAFAQWCQAGRAYQAVWVSINPDVKDELRDAIQKMWQDNNIHPGGLKTYGGAGHVVWIDEGRVVDSDWCWEFYDEAKLRARTLAVFK